MDARPSSAANGATVVLMHGKAFGGNYFLNVTLYEHGVHSTDPDELRNE